MDLLVIGAGPVGRALAGGWSAAGHAVTLAVRDPAAARHDTYRATHRLVAARSLPSADITVLAVPGDQLPAVLEANGRQLDGRLLTDATNTMGAARLHQLPLLTRRLPAARVYRAFTTTGWENFAPEVAGERPDLFYAGPDTPDRQVIETLIADIGPRPLWAGAGPDAADRLDALAQLWFALALRRGLGRHLALRVLAGVAEPTPVAAVAPRAVTIVGRGRIGRALGDAWTGAGHHVTYAVRGAVNDTPSPDGSTVRNVAAALAASDIVVLAVPGAAVATLLREHGETLRGRLLIDATNGAAGDTAAAAATVRARYARAFNTLGVENLRSPRITGTPADMIFTAPDPDRRIVAELITAAGLRPVWLPAGSEPIVNGLLPVWIALAATHGRHLAWRVLTDNPEL
ncbi:NADPH-dependent F420 reductase [Actinoplanes sp. CA-030573]|uniref:NADPH-dependent F420 reductase n=1 Tax=Actinoplanes sp. CA-030573 TaxID=3239898 RepID=UPI003D8A76FD